MPERSFFLRGYQLPVCARCTGMMIGYILAIVLAIFGIRIDYLICMFLVLPLIVDGTVQYATRYTSNNFKRFISGIMYGVGCIQLITNLAYFVGELYE